MKKIFCSILLFTIFSFCSAQNEIEIKSMEYLEDIKYELQKKWPENRTINLVFHGHSVPAGYWHNSEVHTFHSYPSLVLKKIKEQYPNAVVNVIITAIGGENSVEGQKRMAEDVLTHRPDVLFIDYALNDIGIEVKKVKTAWEKMIVAALEANIKVVLVTPSPDQRQNILDPDNPLVLRAKLISSLSDKFEVGLADPFAVFQKMAKKEGAVKNYMSHVNHPNKEGHEIIAKEISDFFLN